MGLMPWDGILEVVNTVITKAFPNEDDRLKAQAALLSAQMNGELEATKVQLSAILAEAQSADPWTSRARPTFLYVMYAMFILCMIGAIIGIWSPKSVFQAADNLQKLLNAIPDSLYGLFGTGYLGYGVMRTWEKGKGVSK